MISLIFQTLKPWRVLEILPYSFFDLFLAHFDRLLIRYELDCLSLLLVQLLLFLQPHAPQKILSRYIQKHGEIQNTLKQKNPNIHETKLVLLFERWYKVREKQYKIRANQNHNLVCDKNNIVLSINHGLSLYCPQCHQKGYMHNSKYL